MYYLTNISRADETQRMKMDKNKYEQQPKQNAYNSIVYKNNE